MIQNWENKVVFLTGASSGIGEALAIALAEKGAILGLLARREDLLKQLAEKCEQAGGQARVLACDVTDERGVTESVNKFQNEFGKIDILICNAGIGGSAHAKNLTNELFRKVIDVNLMGAVYALTAVLPKMIEQNSGQLVAISSLAGIRGLPMSASYSASKGAMTNFFESLRLDLLKTNISVTIIQPGFILTPLTAERKNKLPFLMKLEDAIPLFIKAIEKKKRFSAFPWQLATIVRLGRLFPGWLYDKIAGNTNYREQKE
ncbi:MAG: SDR family NAD(P)-dependent oxidoreductase [Pyrinomonadaceae bacterium]|nr:SDR family NAD(P)-dependent oxidoreductase [Pyrinomonadaceae bacterium]